MTARTTVGILGVGAATPRWRLTAAEIATAWNRSNLGRGQTSVCSPDEDSLTLAWDAATQALAVSGLDADSVHGLWWGTTTLPFAEGPSHAVLANALGLGHRSTGATCSGSAHAGIEALLAAADAVAAGSVEYALVVVSDSVRPAPGTGFESRAGAGAAAVVLSGGPAPAQLGERHTESRPLLDRYRGTGELDQRDLYDGRLFREEIFLPVVGAVIDAVGSSQDTTWSLPDPDGRLGAVLAKRTGAGPATSAGIYHELGDTGAAAALLGAIGAWERAGRHAVVAYGGGRATVVVVEVRDAVPGAAEVASCCADGVEVGYTRALRSRTQLVPGGETIPMGVPPESALFARGAEEMLQLLGARCVDCGTISSPPSIHPHCVACGGPKLEPTKLARSGTVHTYVVNHTMPAPFEAPLPIAVIDLDDGARIMLQADDDGSNIEIGQRVELVLRKYAHERGVPVYGYKARPVRDATPTTSTGTGSTR
jgi:hydroxymethylglutaryl-CoA synthase